MSVKEIVSLLENKMKKYNVDDIFSSYNAGLKRVKDIYVPIRCNKFRRFTWHKSKPVVCYKGEYINQEYVWYSRRYYNSLKRGENDRK